MNKKELATVVVLILLIPVVLEIDRRFFRTPVPEAPPREEVADSPRAPTPEDSGFVAEEEEPLDAWEVAEPEPPGMEEWEVEEEDEPVPEGTEASVVTLENDYLSLEVTSMGAGVRRVLLKRFPKSIEDNQLRESEEIWSEESEWRPIEFDFRDSPALVYHTGGMSAREAFALEERQPGRHVRLTREVIPGIYFHRDMFLEEEYTVRVRDVWENRTSEERAIPEMPLWIGRMRPLEDVSQRFGPFMGVDALHTGGHGVRHYVKDITRWAGEADGIREESEELGLDWFTAKNKFFTQVLTVMPGSSRARELLIRTAPGTGDARVGMVQSGARITGASLAPGTTFEREFEYYAGPMLLENLRGLGMGQEEMIDVRLWRIFVPLGKLMLNGLNGLHGVVGNWGVAIILLTVVVRLLFWPLTAKGADNMRKMSELSPQIKEIREKYKSNPQKMNQEMGAFYREHKVNPMAGCLPMVVQIPVFFSLYGVLRIAVELRFAEFLWVRDLSEPEHLFDLLGFPVNILPLTMGATMILQQRMTPSSMDPQQKKIMMMMPIVFLFITYNMPSGLLLYWTTSNLISIYQSHHTRKKQAAAADKEPKGAASKESAPQGGKGQKPQQLQKRTPPKKKKK